MLKIYIKFYNLNKYKMPGSNQRIFRSQSERILNKNFITTFSNPNTTPVTNYGNYHLYLQYFNYGNQLIRYMNKL